MILQIHKDKTDAVNLLDVANNFVGERANRKQFFWQIFSERCSHKSVLCDKVDTNCGIVNSISIYLT